MRAWSRCALVAIAGLIAALAADASAHSGAALSGADEKMGDERQARILLTVKGETSWDVFTIRPDGTGLRNLTRHPDDDIDATWAPATDQIAFVRLAHGDEPSPDEDLYVMNADGSGATRLHLHGYFAWPKWSPDGRTISFLEPTSFSSLGPDGELFRLHCIPVAGGVDRLIADGAAASSDAWSWSPSGRRITFQRLDPAERHLQVAIADLDTGRMRTLTNGSYPAWSPVDPWIAYKFDRGIHLIRSDGRQRRRLTRGHDSGISWSPDGRSLAFIRTTNGQRRYHVEVIRSDGSRLRRLFTTARPIATPLVWSPDGRRLAWSLGYDPPGAVYIAPSDGTGAARRLTSGFVAGWTRVPARLP